MSEVAILWTMFSRRITRFSYECHIDKQITGVAFHSFLKAKSEMKTRTQELNRRGNWLSSGRFPPIFHQLVAALPFWLSGRVKNVKGKKMRAFSRISIWSEMYNVTSKRYRASWFTPTTLYRRRWPGNWFVSMLAFGWRVEESSLRICVPN